MMRDTAFSFAQEDDNTVFIWIPLYKYNFLENNKTYPAGQTNRYAAVLPVLLETH